MNTLINNHLYCRTFTEIPESAWTKEEFKEQINKLSYRYHINHPVDQYIMEGKATKEFIQSWVANRFYYQTIIPMKDATIISKCTDQKVRQEWVKNILDHDLPNGGIDNWILLAEKVGINKQDLINFKHVLPGVKFACNEYINFVKSADWKLAIASCLTVVYADEIHTARINNWPNHYEWLDKDAYSYFRNRQNEAKHEKDVALNYVLEWFTKAEDQVKVLETIKLKQDILWSILDNLYIFHFTHFYDTNQ